MRTLAVVLALAAILPAASGAAPQRGFAFGRLGGNIVPFTVSIGNDGRVKATGPVLVGRAHLTQLEVANLDRVATMNGFASLRSSTSCPGTLPDVAATFVRVGPRTVRVHGSCVVRYQRIWNALARTVRLEYG
jgi:hypothetical protein